MSTRGFIGFVADGEVKVAYCHHDAYPEWLGRNMLEWARSADPEAAKAAVRALRVVRDEEPTELDQRELVRFADFSVGSASEKPSWYQLLRGTQGDPAAILEAGVMEDASDFPADSPFAEYGYIVDLDTGVFEAYEGFQQSPHTDGRFAKPQPGRGGYYPVRLKQSWPLSGLPDDAAFLEAFEDGA